LTARRERPMSGAPRGPTAGRGRSQGADRVDTIGAPDAERATRPGGRGTVVYFIGEDWFFCSHFVPMARAAREDGFEVVVLTRPGERRAEIERHGFRVVTLDFARNDLNPLRKLSTVRQVAAVLARERPAVLHNVALSYAIVGTLAGRMARVPAIVNAITGLGYLLVSPSPAVRLLRFGLWRTLPLLFGASRVSFLFENPDDAAMAVRHRWTVPGRITIVPGAGVDVDHFAPLPDPAESPVRIALVGRMLWQKGPDVAVEAKRLLDRRGVACELWLVGRSDPDNPRAIPRPELERWAGEPGIRWTGFSPDVRAIWRACHVAVAPSRGGEGLPRSLIEAAACGRPLVATDVPGSREIVRPGVNGIRVPPGDPAALAEALERLVRDAALRRAYGAASRAIAEAEYRDTLVGAKVAALYRSLSGQA
jgi:glycosyltransferase involved in cell wall biosynthesis